MAITYSLKITQIDTIPNNTDNIVVCVHWAYSVSDGDRSAGFGGKTELSYTPGDPFTPYAELTEDQVTRWVMESFDIDVLAKLQTTLADQMYLQASKLPWVPEVKYVSEYVSIPREEIMKA